MELINTRSILSTFEISISFYLNGRSLFILKENIRKLEAEESLCAYEWIDSPWLKCI